MEWSLGCLEQAVRRSKEWRWVESRDGKCMYMAGDRLLAVTATPDVIGMGVRSTAAEVADACP